MTILDEIKKEVEKIGIEKGREEGERKKAIETAKKMKQDGVDTKSISNYTNLSIGEIEKL